MTRLQLLMMFARLKKSFDQAIKEYITYKETFHVSNLICKYVVLLAFYTRIDIHR